MSNHPKCDSMMGRSTKKTGVSSFSSVTGFGQTGQNFRTVNKDSFGKRFTTTGQTISCIWNQSWPVSRSNSLPWHSTDSLSAKHNLQRNLILKANEGGASSSALCGPFGACEWFHIVFSRWWVHWSCVCVCVWERECERKRQRERTLRVYKVKKNTHTHTHKKKNSLLCCALYSRQSDFFWFQKKFQDNFFLPSVCGHACAVNHLGVTGSFVTSQLRGCREMSTVLLAPWQLTIAEQKKLCQQRKCDMD